MKDRASERIQLLNQDGSEALFDLSKTGAGLLHAEAKKKDALLIVEINGLALNSKVVYCQERMDGFRIGVNFQTVGPDKQKALDDLVDEFSRGVPLTAKIIELSQVKV